jgi:hypothetical protein
MSKLLRHQRLPLEVSSMFEPHRQQHELLHAAYASLVPPLRRRLGSGTGSAPAPQPQRHHPPQERKTL